MKGVREQKKRPVSVQGTVFLSPGPRKCPHYTFGTRGNRTHDLELSASGISQLHHATRDERYLIIIIHNQMIRMYEAIVVQVRLILPVRYLGT